MRDIARLYSQRKLFSAIRVEEAVKGWIEERFGVVETGRGFPDLIGIDEDGESHGFEVITARSSSTLSVGLKRLRELAARHPELNSLKTFTLVIVMASPSEVDEARHVISRQRRPWLPDEWRCVIGFLEQGNPPVFTAYATM